MESPLMQYAASIPRQSGLLDPKAKSLIDWLQAYAQRKVNSMLWDARRCLPPGVILDFGMSGLFGMNVPRRHGGLELSNYSISRILQQLGAIDTTLATLVVNNNFLGIHPVVKFAPDEIREEYLPLFAAGRQLISYALTEPSAGSNPLSMKGRALPRADGGWDIHATKIWIGGASWAGALNVFVKLVDGRNLPQGITCFFVRADSANLEIGPEQLTMGMRSMVQNRIVLRGTPVGESDILGAAKAGMEVAHDAMMQTRLAFGAMFLGSMRRCVQLAHRYAGRRNSISTGSLLANHVSLARLSRMIAKIKLLDALVSEISLGLDAGKRIPEELFVVAKTAGSEFLWESADDLVQLLGARGYLENNIAAQILRDARVGRIFEGPTETLLSFIGSRSIKNQSGILPFIRDALSDSETAGRLEACLERVRADLHGHGNERIYWHNYKMGEALSWGILLACLKRRSNDQACGAWASARLQATLADIRDWRESGKHVLSENEIKGFALESLESISDLEQSMSGEEWGLDPYLRKASRPDFDFNPPGMDPPGMPESNSGA
jgi:alkylation response protein AidB-like acyl-CoA dehydrogenase